jgi:enamine deaminase RidA (YjgF/YER057c/UK114 family)
MSERRPAAAHGLAIEDVWGYSQAIVADGLVHVAGQVPRDSTGTPVVGTLEVAFAKTVENLSAALEQVGSSLDQLTYTQWHFAAEDLDQGQELFRRVLGGIAPAATFVAVAGLNHPDYALEVSAIAALPDSGAAPRELVWGEGPGGASAAVAAADWLFVSALAGADAGADPAASLDAAAAEVRAVVERAGFEVADLGYLNAFTPFELDAVGDVVAAFGEGVTATSSIVQVPRLASGESGVEVSAFAVKG